MIIIESFNKNNMMITINQSSNLNFAPGQLCSHAFDKESLGILVGVSSDVLTIVWSKPPNTSEINKFFDNMLALLILANKELNEFHGAILTFIVKTCILGAKSV